MAQVANGPSIIEKRMMSLNELSENPKWLFDIVEAELEKIPGDRNPRLHTARICLMELYRLVQSKQTIEISLPTLKKLLAEGKL